MNNKMIENSSKSKMDEGKLKKRKLAEYIKEYKFVFIFFISIVSLGLGIIGNNKYNSRQLIHQNFGTILYNSISLFNFSGDFDYEPIPIELEISRWLSPAVSIYAVLWGIARLFGEQIDSFRIKFLSNHVIICGLGNKGIRLAKDYRSKGKKVVVIETDPNNPNLSLCKDYKIFIIIGNASEDNILLKSGIKRASHIIVVCNNDITNASVFLKIKSLVKSKHLREIRCSVHIEMPSFWTYIRLKDYSNQKFPNFHVDYFNIFNLAARYLLSKYLTDSRFMGEMGIPCFTIVGLDELGEQLILNAAREIYYQNNQFDCKLYIRIFDKEAKKKIMVLNEKYPKLREICLWQEVEIDNKDPEFFRANFFTELHLPNYNQNIFLCSNDDISNINAGLTIINQIQNNTHQVIIPVKTEPGFIELLSQNDNIKICFNLNLINIFKISCTSNLLDKGSREEIACVIHKEYLNTFNKDDLKELTSRAFVNWEYLPEDLKEMNRKQADDIISKLSLVSCEVVPWYSLGGDKFMFSSEELEILSRNEHERWCKQKIEMGWTYGNIRDENKKIHPSIISWDDPRLSEMDKQKDINSVKLIPKYLALAGFQIIRHDNKLPNKEAFVPK
ncbi:NAD-binding protein [Candidatus Dojkabacteria bacterium]|nr:NAD-binding protein [Candidatus Dojkabacteria bacterium]